MAVNCVAGDILEAPCVDVLCGFLMLFLMRWAGRGVRGSRCDLVLPVLAFASLCLCSVKDA